MNAELPLLPVSSIGSLPKPAELFRAEMAPLAEQDREAMRRAQEAAVADWLRGRLSLILVCGQGMWEDTTGALVSTKAFGGVLAEKGIPHEVDLWGHDVPHDWPSWRAQFAHHLPRFC